MIEIKQVIDTILDSAEKERRSSEPYKDLFKKTDGKPFCVQLSSVESEMVKVVLNYNSILKQNGFRLNDEAFRFMLALPLTAHLLEEDIRKKEGNACCVDKTYNLLHKEFKRLLDIK